MTSEHYDITEPRAEAMIHSLRAFGYDLTTAVADLIDNSISADAKRIWIDAEWDGEQSVLAITDDGKGMNEDELVRGMRLGSRSPLLARDPKDLGRYGLGLKTASFSQCRVLTVKSKHAEGGFAASDIDGPVRCWDLDYVTQTQEWRLLRTVRSDAEPYFARLDGLEHGTVVVWERMDRLVQGTSIDSRTDQDRFLEHVDAVYRHVAMVFHRFLEQSKPLRIWVNDRPVVPWNPFLPKASATQTLGVEELTLRGRRVTVTPYVLPHHSKLTEDLHLEAAGIKGWNAHQGFYVYRNRRMLVDGDWLGLGFQKEEHYKLARIQVDLPNDMDDDWEIDVKKSKAKPPAAFRSDLKRIAKLTRERAAGIYRHRGKVIARQTAAEYVYPWSQQVRHGKIFYRINREHPLVKSLLDGAGLERTQVTALLQLLEETVPVTQIAITNAEKPDQHGKPFEGRPAKEVAEVMQAALEALLASGLDKEDAIFRLATMEPFDQYPELVAACREQLEVKP